MNCFPFQHHLQGTRRPRKPRDGPHRLRRSLRRSNTLEESNDEWEEQELGVEPLENPRPPPPLPLRNSIYAPQGSFDPNINTASASPANQILPVSQNSFLDPFVNERNRLHSLLMALGRAYPSLGIRSDISIEQNLLCLRQGFVNADATLRNHSKDMSMVQDLKKSNKALKKDVNQIEKDLGAEMAERQRMQRQITQFKTERTQREERYRRDLENCRGQQRGEMLLKSQKIEKLERELTDLQELQESKIQSAKDELSRSHRVETAALTAKTAELQELLQSERIDFEKQRTSDREYYEQKMQAERAASKEREAQLTLQLRSQLEAARSALVNREHLEGMTDPELEESFELLRNAVREAARVRWDPAKEWYWPYSEATVEGAPNPRKLKQQIVQASMWAILFEDLFSTPFKIFAEDGATWQYEWTKQFGTDLYSSHMPPWPRPSANSERWRYEKVESARDSLDQMGGLKQKYESCINAISRRLSSGIEKICSPDGYKPNELHALVKQAAEFWLSVCSQRYRVQILVPPSSGNILQGQRQSATHISLVVSPALQRIGNSTGDALDKAEIVRNCESVVEQHNMT